MLVSFFSVKRKTGLSLVPNSSFLLLSFPLDIFATTKKTSAKKKANNTTTTSDSKEKAAPETSTDASFDDPLNALG